MGVYLGKENSFMQMDLFTMASLKKGKNMEMEFITLLTVICMMVNGFKM